MPGLPYPSMKQKRNTVIVFAVLAFLYWFSFLYESFGYFRLLDTSIQLSGPFKAIGAFGFVSQLLFIYVLSYVYELNAGKRRIYIIVLAVAVLALLASFIFTNTLLGIGKIALYEPLFMTFLLFHAIFYQYVSRSSAHET